jgi:hypothetical protein
VALTSPAALESCPSESRAFLPLVAVYLTFVRANFVDDDFRRNIRFAFFGLAA